MDPAKNYRGRLAPSPTGYLHLGHARTFWIAQQRAQDTGGTLILRNDDLDRARCRAEITGPSWVVGSEGSPMRIFSVFAFSFSTNSS